MKPALPSSDAFWILASGYRDAGDAVLARIRTETYMGFALFPCVFLYFRCVELALKSVLAYHPVPEDEITRTLGHRISALIERAEEFSSISELGISAEDRRVLDQFSDDYSTKWFEYPDDLDKNYPELERLRDLAHRVCDAIQAYERRRANPSLTS
jgi:hypothetical protein